MKKTYVLALAVIVVFGVFLVLYYGGNFRNVPFATLNSDLTPTPYEKTIEPVETPTQNETPNKSEISEFEKLMQEVSRERAFEEMRRPHREKYGIPMEVFAELPPIPDDFGTMTYMFEVGRWKDLTYFTEEYYKQPEFYPNFEAAGLRWWKEPNPSSWGVIGWGAYPADIWVNTYPGAEFEAKTFWHTGWGIQTYQGVKLAPTYPATSADANGRIFNVQNPEEVSKYFDVTFDEPVFLLSPTYPKFGKDWARAIKVRVKVKENTPKGEYVLGVDPVMPPEEVRTEWLLKYKMLYFDAASSGISINRPHFRLIIKVN
ncbi:MAG: hypothetical protein N3F05_04800 [Candidatus Diapherotrites archaeon]|nr:hypothetical protein [Candidatus Diapherotrites archaeon]